MKFWPRNKYEWSQKWLACCNSNKMECMTISLKQKKPFHPSLILTISTLNIKNRINTSEYQYVAIFHGTCISMKYSVLSTMVRKVKCLLNRNSVLRIVLLLYETSPRICWCHWDNILEYLSFKTENIQLEAQNVTGVID